MPGDYNAEYIVLISIGRGIGQGPILGGMSWGFGDDWVWQFRKVGENVHVVRRNVRFTADTNSPEAKAVAAAYTDSVLFSLPIVTKGPKGGDLVDLTPVFMSDLPQIGRVLPGFQFSPQKSTWAEVKGFPDNVELQVAATYASGGQAEIDSVPDSRGVTINVHYSISELPQHRLSAAAGRRPRRLLPHGRSRTFRGRATATGSCATSTAGTCRRPTPRPRCRRRRSRSSSGSRRRFRSSIASRSATASRNGTRRSRRPASSTRSKSASSPTTTTGIPEDIRYNTFRWITSSAGFAMGPSRVNPDTGQILDADIIFDADFLQIWKQEYETFTPRDDRRDDRRRARDLQRRSSTRPRAILRRPPADGGDCQLATGMSRQLAFGAAAILADARPEDREAEPGEADHAGPEGSDDARGRPHARPAAQLQGQHVA